MRKPLAEWQPYKGAGGAHEGVQPANVHPLIFKACQDGKRIDSVLYEQLHTVIDLDGLLDILEMQDVLASWRHAEMKNVDDNRDNR